MYCIQIKKQIAASVIWADQSDQTSQTNIHFKNVNSCNSLLCICVYFLYSRSPKTRDWGKSWHSNGSGNVLETQSRFQTPNVLCPLWWENQCLSFGAAIECIRRQEKLLRIVKIIEALTLSRKHTGPESRLVELSVRHLAPRADGIDRWRARGGQHRWSVPCDAKCHVQTFTGGELFGPNVTVSRRPHSSPSGRMIPPVRAHTLTLPQV